LELDALALQTGELGLLLEVEHAAGGVPSDALVVPEQLLQEVLEVLLGVLLVLGFELLVVPRDQRLEHVRLDPILLILHLALLLLTDPLE